MRAGATGIMVDLGGSRQPLQWDARQRPTCGALHGELRHRTVKDQRKVPVVPHRRLHRPHRLHAASVLLTWGGERKKGEHHSRPIMNARQSLVPTITSSLVS